MGISVRCPCYHSATFSRSFPSTSCESSRRSLWGGGNETDISYYSPAFFRHFAALAGDEDWIRIADDTHAIRDAAANGNTGLVPDWQSVSGSAGAGGRSGNFGYDAIRVPCKHCLDDFFRGNEAAGAWCEKVTHWANSVTPQGIRDGYGLSGNVIGNSHNMTAVGTFAVAAMANPQQVADAFAKSRRICYLHALMGDTF